MKKILFFAALFTCLLLNAQDQKLKQLKDESSKSAKKDPSDTSSKIWKSGGLYSLNVSQGSLSNWAAGGDNFSISVNSLLSLFAFYKKDKYSWDNTFDFNLGYAGAVCLEHTLNSFTI